MPEWILDFQWSDLKPTDFINPLFVLLLIFMTLLLHEMGHFLAARVFKIPVESFVIGRGKVLKEWRTKTGIKCSLHRWPWGAHVQLGTAFADKPFYQRFITILAGPCSNFVILPFLFFTFYIAFGVPSGPPVLVGVAHDGAAKVAGFMPGDRFIDMDGIATPTSADLWQVAYEKPIEENHYTIERNGQTLTIAFTPEYKVYRTEEGIERENSIWGVTWTHTPYALKDVMQVDGVDVYRNEALARQLLMDVMDTDTVIGIKDAEGEMTLYDMHPKSTNNPNINNKNHDDYKAVYLGASHGNFYHRQPFMENVVDAAHESWKLLTDILTIPLQLFPLDKTKVNDADAVQNDITPFMNWVYIMLHKFAVISVVIGMINFLPFPNLDGGQLLIQTTEQVTGGTLSNKNKAWLFVVAFGFLYVFIAASNAGNLPYYIDSKLKKFQELIEHKNVNDLNKE